MDISPQAISSASFPVVKKGFDPDHVRSYLAEVGRALESAQNQSTAMEARARAAVAKLQELTQATAKAPSDGGSTINADDAETISRTLLLAQKAADATIAEARQEADTMVSAARAESANVLSEARRQAAVHIDEARAEARRVSEADKQKVESEVQALLARREFLLSDVEHLEEFVSTQRRRVQDVASLLAEVAERGPGGLGEARRPLLSAAGDAGPSSGATGSSAASTVAAASTSTSTAEATVSELWDAEPSSRTENVTVVTEPETAPEELLDTTSGTGDDDWADDDGDDDEGDDSYDWADEGTTVMAAVPAEEEASTSPSLAALVADIPDDEFVETERTPAQSPALLDFDDLDTTSEIPAVAPQSDESPRMGD